MDREARVRTVAAIAALVGWAVLALQWVLITDKLGIGLGTWRFVGFFTILSNIAIAAIASAIALSPQCADRAARAAGGPSPRSSPSASSIRCCCATVEPAGVGQGRRPWAALLTPVLFAILWAMMPHGQLRWRDLGWALAARRSTLAMRSRGGSVDGWYPYFFLDPSTQDPASLLASIAGVIVAFGVIGASGIAVDQRLARSAFAQPDAIRS